MQAEIKILTPDQVAYITALSNKERHEFVKMAVTERKIPWRTKAGVFYRPVTGEQAGEMWQYSAFLDKCPGMAQEDKDDS